MAKDQPNKGNVQGDSQGDVSLSSEGAKQASAIARQTMSPFCPGRTLADCPSPYAAQWRGEIRRMVADGMSPSEIRDELERRAGSNLSGSPHRDASWGVPIAFGLLSLGVLGAVFLRMRRHDSGGPREVDPEAGDATNPADEEGPADDSPPIADARLRQELEREGGFDEDED